MSSLLDSIPANENLITGLLGRIFKEGTSPANKKDTGRQDFMIIILVTALFLVVGTEPLKVVLRKNIGKKALSIWGIVIATILYIGWAGIMYAILYFTNIDDDISSFPAYFQYIFNQYILWSGIICYLIFAVYIFIRGLDEYYRAKADKNDDLGNVLYRGDSIMMVKHINNRVDQGIIWRVIEPKACFRVALLLTLFNPVIGLLILLTSISFWVNEWYHVHFKWVRMQEAYREMKMQAEMANFQFNRNNTNQDRSNGGVR